MKCFVILVLSFAIIVNARPQQQEYDDYDQPTSRSGKKIQQSQASQQLRPRSSEDLRETSTYVPIVSQDKQQETDGSYKSSYETGNNIFHEEQGTIKENPLTVNDENPDGILVQKGSYSYETPDGEIINVNYEADERGFRVSGDHLPTPPPVSPEIQKGLDLIYAGIRLQEERRNKNPNYVIDKAERERLNYLGLWTGN